jgi:hypothetical protein
VEQGQIEQFWAVTTHNEVFRVRKVTNRTAQATKIAQHGVLIGEFSLKGSGKILISSCLGIGGAADGKSAPIAALFLEKKPAMVCSRTTELHPCDSRWEQETLKVVSAVESDHPVFAVGRDPGNRLRFFN